MLSLNDLIQIIVNLPGQAVQLQNFSLEMLLSQNTVISTTDRVKIYNSTDEMVADGFAAASPEVLAAGLFFKQSPKPSQIAVGVQGTDETITDALTACRRANTQWYICILIGAVSADILLAAAYIESASPASRLFYTTSDVDVKSGAADNLCKALQAAKYKKTLGQYSTHADAVASIAGYVAGQTNANVAFDLAYKSEPGVTPNNLDPTEATVLKGENCNYLAYYNSTALSFFWNGVMADGSFFDDGLGIDILSQDIQSAYISALTSEPKVPGTDDGASILTTAIATACNAALKRGFLAAGTWTGQPVLNLKTGDSLPDGYSIQIDSVNNRTADDKAARKAPPAYVCIIRAGSLQTFTIYVNVQ